MTTVSTTSDRGLVATPLVENEPVELILEPRSGWIPINWSELWRSRELLYFLVWRDVKVRYKQTILGLAWAVLQPLFNALILNFVFRQAGFAADIPVPYFVFIYAGWLVWGFFSATINGGSMSLLNQQHLLTKVYFPRLYIPTATAGGALVDMLISAAVFALLLIPYHCVPSWQIVFLPLLILLSGIGALGITYVLSSLTVAYRDFRFLIPFVMQAWMWLSPIFYMPDKVFGRYTPLSYINPMVGIISGCRSSIFGSSVFPWNFPALGVAAAVCGGSFVIGAFYFRKTERRFADIA